MSYVVASETDVLAAIRLDAANRGIMLFRNNSGVLRNERGTPVRFGLGNDSAALNKRLKSADLIGFRTVLITAEMVGTGIAQFHSYEAKPSDWRPALSGKRYEHEEAQRRWAELVNAAGGVGRIMTGVE